MAAQGVGQEAQRHPDWLHAYTSLGQITDGMESERRGWQYTMDAARREGSNAESKAAKPAPEYTDADLRTMWDGTGLSSSRMLTDVLAQGFSKLTTFDCPSSSSTGGTTTTCR